MSRLSLAFVLVLTAACSQEVSGPTPVVDSVAPALVCTEQLTTVVTITGESLSPLAIDAATGDPLLAIPDVALTRIQDLTGAPVAGAPTITLPNDPLAPAMAHVRWTSATAMQFDVYPDLALESGLYRVTVTNRNGNAASLDVAITAVPRPTLTAVEPDLFCVAGGGQTVMLRGMDFIQANGVNPTVTFTDGAGVATTFSADSVADCTPLPGTTPAMDCRTALVTVPDTLATGAYTVVVTNPPTADCESTDAVTVAVVAPPVITAVAPPTICDAVPTATLDLLGDGFLVIGGVDPTVTLDGAPVAVTATAGCQPVAGTLLDAQSCTSITVDLPATPLTPGTHELIVTNPPPADCASEIFTFAVASAPVLTSVTPFKVCSDGGQFAVNGTGFVDTAQISVNPSGGGASTAVPTLFVSDIEVDGTVTPGSLTAGLYDVTVDNGGGCSSTLPDSLRIVDAPFVFYADPPFVYNGINLQITIYLSGVTDDITAVGLRPTGTILPPTPLAFSYDPARPSRILATVPAGTAAGDYDIVVADVACGAEFLNGLHVTDTLTVDVTAIDPPFGWTGDRTTVTIRSSVTPPAGMESFEPTPRAYLNPTLPGALARELVAVQFQDPTRLTGTVADGLATGVYDVVVINPDGDVGLLPGAFTVVADPLPRIDSITPGSIINQPAQSVSINGSDFRAPVTIGTSCIDQTGAAVASLPVVVGATTATSIAVTFDAGAAPGGTVCVLRVTNADGTYADFSALSVTTPSANLNPFQSSTSMLTGRRAAAAAALRLNGVQRFLFAIGGDAGSAGTEHASVEAAPVDPFGVVGAWAAQRNSLPAGRSFTAAATVGRFVYLPGGTAGGGPTTSVLRAYLLDPFEAPEISDLDLVLGMGVGLDGGIYYYRVAAVMDATDPNNPGGEGLASEPLVVQAPDLVSKVHLTLYWTAVPGAVSYRIYRSPTPGLIAGSEQLMIETAATGPGTQSFTDSGLTVAPGAAVPLPLGSLGVWHEVGPLTTARTGAGVVAVTDPNDASRAYLYVIGGMTTGGTVVNSYEWSVITTSAPGAQTIAAFTSGSLGPFTARWQLGAVSIDSTRATVVPAGDAWVYALTGFDAAGASVNQVVALRVDTVDGSGADDGSLGSATLVAAPAVGGGTGYAAGNNFLYTFGGGSGAPTATGKSAGVCQVGEAGCAGGAPEPPDLKNWNAGISLVLPRYLQATASESGFVFQVGGTTATDAASATTERTNF